LQLELQNLSQNDVPAENETPPPCRCGSRTQAKPQVSRRRANQLGNLVRVLKLGTVDLDDRVRIAKEHFGRRSYHARCP